MAAIIMKPALAWLVYTKFVARVTIVKVVQIKKIGNKELDIV